MKQYCKTYPIAIAVKSPFEKLLAKGKAGPGVSLIEAENESASALCFSTSVDIFGARQPFRQADTDALRAQDEGDRWSSVIITDP
jgi:hypothetical protein